MTFKKCWLLLVKQLNPPMQVIFNKAIDSKAPIETQISVITTDKCFHDLQHNYNLLSGNATVVCYTTGPLFYIQAKQDHDSPICNGHISFSQCIHSKSQSYYVGTLHTCFSASPCATNGIVEGGNYISWATKNGAWKSLGES